jgi:hypothetical protein
MSYGFDLVTVRVVHVESAHAFEHRVNARTNLDASVSR